ncbi:MAG: hypothetical protein KJ914_00880 [Gammaproteobacteria bacterium]|nr:hypothetical protein [Gammaproteobacteria bacterium]MBU1723172.1 hypothetical protein [Gammaproteobacteria bacterium]MBU2005415.1 hypothetical protein [Gammaproteobacteria bacterium]
MWKTPLLCGFVLLASAVHAAEVPDPISLDQALNYAEGHPRTQLAPDIAQQHPLPEPLYLDCHGLAYNNSGISPDSQRDRLLTTLVSPLEAQRLDIMRRFFDVLLADSSAVRDNENQAVYFIPLDRTRTRMELKEFSELDVAELDAEYQVVRQQTTASTASQRLTRSLLAQSINNPQKLPSELNPPEIGEFPAEMPPLDELVATSLKSNGWLEDRRDDASSAERTVIDMELRQTLIELLLRLDIFKVAAERAEAEILWRDYYLERSRTLYEQEVKSDLGDAMTQQSKARLQKQQFQFCRALTLAQLHALQGKPVWPLPTPTKQAEEKPE